MSSVPPPPPVVAAVPPPPPPVPPASSTSAPATAPAAQNKEIISQWVEKVLAFSTEYTGWPASNVIGKQNFLSGWRTSKKNFLFYFLIHNRRKQHLSKLW